MTDASARDAAQDALAISADTMAHDFVAALLDELRNMPDHWARLAQEKQQQLIERLKEKVRQATGKALHIMLRSEFPAVPAELDSINLKNGITASLKIGKAELYRHALFDAQGSQVLIVVADPERWMNRIDEIKAKDDQLELFAGGDYDPAIDQPAYRRDQDRVAPAGTTWDKLKAQLNEKGKDAVSKPAEKSDAAKADEVHKQDLYYQVFASIYGKAPNELTPTEMDSEKAKQAHAETQRKIESGEPLLFGTAASEGEEKRAAEGMLQEQLTGVGVAVSIGTIQSWSADEMRVVREWIDAYGKDPANCPIARPHWLPLPDRSAGDAA